MDRCCPRLLLALGLALLMSLAGCAGKSSNVPGNDTVQSVTLSPNSNNISIDLGSTNLVFQGIARNGLGQVVPIGVSFVSSNNAALTVAHNGQACAGTWDSLSDPVVCHPGVVGVAQVTALVGGISSSPATVYVHQHIDSMAISPLNPQLPDCFSLNDPNPQNTGTTYQATAYSNGVDITDSVGPINWLTTQANVATVSVINHPSCPAPQGQPPCNQTQATARDPGITNLVASVAGVTSNPFPFTTCLVSSVVLQDPNNQSNSINFSGAGSASLEATVFDTHGNIVSNPPLTWGSTNPEVAKFKNATSTNGKNSATIDGNNLGGANLFASCDPPSCNIGVQPGLPIYSVGGLLLNGKPDPHPPNANDKPAFGAFAVSVTNSKIPTFTAWTATTDCDNAQGCVSAMFPVTTSNSNPIGAGVLLPFTPNSLRVTPDGSTGYLGSNQGLMFVTLSGSPTVSTASPLTSPCNIALCGKVLAISPDSTRIVIGDTQSSPNQVYIFSKSSAPVDLTIPSATTAAFSPDGLKLFVLTSTGTMYIYSTVDALTSIAGVGNATDLAFSADGSFAYFAGSTPNTVSGFATCNGAKVGTSPALTGNPLRIFPLAETTETPNTILVGGIPFPVSTIQQELLAVAPPNVQLLTATYTRDPLPPSQFTCQAPQLPQLSFTLGSVFNFGQGNFTPLYMEVTGAGGSFGEKVIVVAQNLPAVLVLDGNGGATTAYPLVNGEFPLAASASPDGSQIFVAACSTPLQKDPQGNFRCYAAPGSPPPGGQIHIVNTQLGGDIQQTPYFNPNTQNSMCSDLDPTLYPCVPNLIAVKPQ